MGAFQRRYEVSPLPGRHHVLHALLDAYHQWGGRERPRIAILDWREVPTYSEFMLFQEYFTSQGYECVIADPRQLEYRRGQLLVDGITPVHLIYKRVLLSELVTREGLDHCVIRAVREHQVCMVNPFRCKLLHKKSSLAVLSDEANADLFSPDERRAIEQLHPLDAQRDRAPHSASTASRSTCSRSSATLKTRSCSSQTMNTAAKGSCWAGRPAQSQWDAALAAALAEPSIVQERVRIPSEPYPSLVEGRVEIYDRLIDTNPYIWYGDYVSGCLTRLSTAELLNVTAGGGSAVPTFVIERRR